MDKHIAIIVPYFGNLPNCFKAWWISALKNPMLEFWFFTDNEHIKSEGNIRVEHMFFSDFAKLIQNNYDFTIQCPQPYKLCDFKPVYGEVFKDRLKDYDYWGYCDVDMVFGNVKRFITDDILEKHDKIFVDGHISIFRNDNRMNTIYRSQGNYPEYNFQEAFTTSDSCYFDEYRGMELKLIREKCNVFNEGTFYINANPKKPHFFGKNGKKIVAKWEDGSLFQIDEEGNRLELMYIHICKREMVLVLDEKDNHIKNMNIVPGKILCNDETSLPGLFEFASGGKLYPYYWMISRLNSQLKRYSLLKIIKLNIRRKQIRELRTKLLSEG
ncbi:hypothetical protein SAMN04487770_11615 [Butyrivibrio sp. ob235]|uniref:DUF6625 family protein n=1 Tax=Butyrivibrio sp. ob235 TaxID=1761780 RepID=UPI0008BCB518|nr:DUF6625 family protein [Butyrivibrio sp. ob235]SEL72997.1 hypothetical protein SAMN04487770_11615 [Butyrivibrio sp. ob235]